MVATPLVILEVDKTKLAIFLSRSTKIIANSSYKVVGWWVQIFTTNSSRNVGKCRKSQFRDLPPDLSPYNTHDMQNISQTRPDPDFLLLT